LTGSAGDSVAPEPGVLPALPQPELPSPVRAKLKPVLRLLASDEMAPSSVVDPARAWSVHVADSLSGLGFQQLASAKRIADVGSGAGFPGLVVAAMLPDSRIDLIEANTRKSEFIERAARAGGILNAHAVNERAEDWAGAQGREAYDAVTARAVARLSTLAELASPLLQADGVLVAWKGHRDPEEEVEFERAAPELGMELVEVRSADPYAGSKNRHLYLLRKVGETPDGLPRRAGMAKKRPRGVI
jgi:16S rRNA (guanine527-N7)-methyltransferase